MPKFGNGSSRPAGAGDRKPRHGKSEAPRTGENFKPREDGRGGRSEGRKPFFEARTPRTDDRGGRPGEDRGARSNDGRRDWAPREDRNAGAGAPRGRFDRDSRPGAGRDDRGSGRPSFGNRDDRGPRTDDRGPRREWAPRDGGSDRAPRSDDRGPRSNDGRRDWAPRSNDRGGRPSFGNRDDRGPRTDDRGPRREWAPREGGSDRAPRTDDRGPRREWAPRDGGSDRGPRRDFGDRDSRPSFGNRDDRGPRREFSDRPRFGGSDDRRPDRADRVERDNSRERSFSDRRETTPNKKAFAEDVVLERLQSADASDVVIAGSFGEMGLHERLVTALEGMGASTPFPIQAATIPAAIEGRDVLGRGKTGSGKTIAFSVPIITKLVAGGSQPRKPNKPRALILAPTRELADQIDRTASQLARAVGFYTTTVYGGVPQRKQEITMSRGVDILVATPGRLEDLMAQRIVDLSEVETIVIDEADHMCDLGFIEGVRRIMKATGESQKLLFSATLDREVDALVREFMPNPFVYEVPNEENDTANIVHRVLVMHDEDRSKVLLRLVQGAEKSMIFVRTKASAESLSESLTQAGVPSARLHGDLNQSQRNRNLERFTKGAVRVLVATDVAARGIHVDDIALVIQLDPPLEYKTYLHRSGRTGRAGKEGTVVTMIPRQRRRRIEDLLNRADRTGIFTDVWPDHELLEQLAGPIAPAPAADLLDFGSSNGGGRGGRDRDRGGDRGPRKGNYGGSGKGRWADRPSGESRPRAKKYND
jgi:superfamily II DNA/RNA helicase